MTIDSNSGTSNIRLPPLLDEFRAALYDEIEVARHNASSSAIPLRSGHRIGELGKAYQYSFRIDSVLNTPDGAPADLIVPGKARLEATIVSVEGLRIAISVESDLGEFVPKARLQADLTILMAKLIERIETNASAQNPAADRMLGNAPVSGNPRSPEDLPNLNENQMCALQSALGCNLTFIWGPPGTGKTYTIGTITEYLHKAGRSVLLVSHTNNAVDQAIKHVARSMREHLEEGAVVRVGEVKDGVLRSDYPDVLLRKQVERRSRDLVKERDHLVEQRQSLADELTELETRISITQWVDSARVEVESLASSSSKFTEMLQRKQSVEDELQGLDDQQASLVELHGRTGKVLALRKKMSAGKNELSRLQASLNEISADHRKITIGLRDQESRIRIAKRITPLRRERSTYASTIEQKSLIASLSSQIEKGKRELEDTQRKHLEASALLDETRTAGVLSRLFRGLPKPAQQQDIVDGLSNTISALNAELSATERACDSATGKLSRILELDGELAQYTGIRSYEDELASQQRLKVRLAEIQTMRKEFERDMFDEQSLVDKLRVEEQQLSETVVGDAKEVYKEVCSRLQRYRELQGALQDLNASINRHRTAITARLSSLVPKMQEWGTLVDLPSHTNEICISVHEAYLDLAKRHSPADLPMLTNRLAPIRSEMQQLSSRIGEIDEKLKHVEHEVIANASVVGATLTKSYLSDQIQGRKFDTVILDEASMAPIPALWAAALLSESNLVIVGDFKQLPPIVLSNNEITNRWLGRDIFEASGLKKRWVKGEAPKYFVPLIEQRRMVPEIAEVANLFYDGLLRNATPTPKGFQEFRLWYNCDWPHDNPVLLVDTGPLNAWVTSIAKGVNKSRLNFLSATVSVDLAERLVSPDGPKRAEASAKRILIVSPYKPHAKLVSVLLTEINHLQDEAVAGTVHSFQGAEADVVIFDLVVDEPHFRVNLFTPALDDQLKCLLNVALTRAKFRLFILGDFDYCLSKGKKAFLGRTLIPFLLNRFPRIDANLVIPDGLAARAAQAQMKVLGGEIDPTSERLVVTQDDFFRLLSSDLARARFRIIIYSPFITQDRLSFLMPQLQAATSRDVEVFLITKSHSERPTSTLSQIKRMEDQLSQVGVVVKHKMRMHEKLVFIDDEITWSGSLNPLSFSDTQEIMERRRSKAVLSDYFQALRLQEFLATHGQPESTCPICGSEMLAAEGKDQPYYWRCENDECYTRGIDQRYPFDGLLSCQACNAPVEFGYWSEYPHWRCTSNKRHRQKIFKSHLRLPKMVDLIPRKERRKVAKILGIESL